MCSTGEVFHVKQGARTSGPGLAAHPLPARAPFNVSRETRLPRRVFGARRSGGTHRSGCAPGQRYCSPLVVSRGTPSRRVDGVGPACASPERPTAEWMTAGPQGPVGASVRRRSRIGSLGRVRCSHGSRCLGRVVRWGSSGARRFRVAPSRRGSRRHATTRHAIKTGPIRRIPALEG